MPGNQLHIPKNLESASATGVPRAQETHPPLGSLYGPTRRPTVGFWGGGGVLMSEVPLYLRVPRRLTGPGRVCARTVTFTRLWIHVYIMLKSGGIEERQKLK